MLFADTKITTKDKVGLDCDVLIYLLLKDLIKHGNNNNHHHFDISLYIY